MNSDEDEDIIIVSQSVSQSYAQNSFPFVVAAGKFLKKRRLIVAPLWPWP